MDFECDFVIRHDDGGLEVEEIRQFKAADLSEAIRLTEEMLKEEPAILHHANAIHLRNGARIRWARAL